MGDRNADNVGIRPQQISVHRARAQANSLPCVVRMTEFQGETTVLSLRTDGDGGADVKAVVPATERYRAGETVWLSFPPQAIHLFDGDLPVPVR